MKAIIYTRYSPKRQKSGESCKIQEDICRKHAERKGYEVITVFHDPDISGKDEYREVLWQAIDALKKGYILLVFKRDRLARNVYLAEQINRAVEKQKAQIQAVLGDIEGDTPETKMIRQILASVAEYEAQMISARTSYAMRQKQRNGVSMSSIPPYGYTKDGKKLIKDKREQMIIDIIKRWKIGKYSFYKITKKLNEDYPTFCRGKKWNQNCVKRIIERDN